MKASTHALTIVLGFALFAATLPHTLAETGAAYFTVSGVVQSDEGKPLGGVQVNAWVSPEDGSRGGYGSGQDVTDDEGRFSMRLPSGKGSLNAYYPEWRASVGQDLALDGNVSGLVLVLKTPPPKTAVIEGRVLDASGSPLPGATVQLQQACCGDTPPPVLLEEPTPAEGGADERKMAASTAIAPCCWEGQAGTTTDADGHYRFAAYPGSYQVTAYAKGHAQSTLRATAKENETTTVDVKLEKVPASVVLKGRVLDAGTGLPIADAQVSLNNMEWGRWASAQSQRDGAFEAKVLPGWTHVSVTVYSRGYAADVASTGAAVDDLALERPLPAQGPEYYSWTRALAVKEGDGELVVKLDRKAAPDVVLTGYVLDPVAKKGIPGATVSIWNQDTGDWGSAITDATGSYRLLARAGHHTANAYAEGHLGGVATFTLAEGEKAKRVNLETPKGESKWAPCDEDCYAVYASDASPMAKGALLDSGPSTGAPSVAPEAAGGRTMASGTASAQSASYQGSGGGLPPYDPSAEAASVGAAKSVPMPGALLAAGLGALVALALRRR